jgi:hypothetical protein
MEKNTTTKTEIMYSTFGRDDRIVWKTKIVTSSRVEAICENLAENGAMEFKFREVG